MTRQVDAISPRAPSIPLHNIRSAGELLEHLNEVRAQIALRASELALACGRMQGYSAEDWEQAKSEFLRPVETEVEEFGGSIHVRVHVLGFEEDELSVSVEPARIIVWAKKERQPERGNKLFYVDWYPDEILEVVKLPEDIDPGLAKITLHSGVLQFELFKAVEWSDWAMGIMDG